MSPGLVVVVVCMGEQLLVPWQVCASGLKAVAIGAANIMCGSQETIVAGGFESMSNIPYIFPKVRCVVVLVIRRPVGARLRP